MFSKKDLEKLIIPLIFEQLLVVTIGIADTVMVASVGEAAVSGISLVDSINILLINIFTAMATAGAIVAAQYLGRGDDEDAGLAARQLILLTFMMSTLITAVSLALRPQILHLVFGDVESAVMKNCLTYFFWSALSYPFLALYNSGASLFRAMGNSKISLVISIAMNITNIAGNAILIFGFGMGVGGAAIASFVSRAMGASVVLYLLRRSQGRIRLDSIFHLGYSAPMIKSILRIGIPGSIESSTFQVGKILVQGVVASLGTVAIASNAIASNLVSVANIPGNAIAVALMTVVGQCVGAKKYKEGKTYIFQLLKVTYITLGILNVISFFAAPYIVGVFRLSPETMEVAVLLIRVYAVASLFIWPLSFYFPAGLRAAGDAKFVLLVSGFSMWVFRIGFCYLLVDVFRMGLLGVWYAMFIDWIFRGICFSLRLRGDKWTSHVIIK